MGHVLPLAIRSCTASLKTHGGQSSVRGRSASSSTSSSRHNWRSTCAIDEKERDSSNSASKERPIMAHKFAVILMDIVEGIFFAGLLGCAVVVVLSWISVGKGCFTDEN